MGWHLGRPRVGRSERQDGMGRVLEPRKAMMVLIGASVAVLAGALVFDYGLGIKPCAMCLWQRWPYAVVLAVLGPGLAFAPRGLLPLLLGGAALAFLVGGGIAVFHVGVEQHWWAGTPSCGVPATPTGGGMMTLEQLRAEIFASPIVRCDVVAWSLFGISLAGFNIVISLALFLFAAAAAGRAMPRRQEA